jgi:hypothetical protein
MNVSEFVKLIDPHEHFCGVKSRVLLFQDARVVEQSSEISSRYVFLVISLTAMPVARSYAPWRDRHARRPGKRTIA